MSRKYRRCKVCGCVLSCHNKLHRGSTICTRCLSDQPYDLNIDVGNFHAELHSDAIRRKDLQKLLSNVKQLAKQIK